jgi:hypothetical protein
MKFLLLSSIFVTLFVLQSSAIWPFDNWNVEEMAFPVLSADVNGTSVSLDNLNDDILHIICSYVKDLRDKAPDDDKPADGPGMPGRYPSEERGQSISALRRWSVMNKRLRDLTVPWLFRNVKVDGNWRKAAWGLKVLESCPGALKQIRYVNIHPQFVQWRGC